MAGVTEYSLPAPVFTRAPKLLIVTAPYYRDIADALLAGARAAAAAVGATIEEIEVPGALEIPPAIAAAARLAEHDGYVALGCVIRGETSHYDTVCNESARGLMQLGLAGLAVGNGILTVENHEQARVRAVDQDKGGGAALAALHLVALGQRWAGQGKGVGFARDRIAPGAPA
ncbi:MAG: 6,7-dimethyl-8-ribityllumazine synthase [Rubellimicrobium sp.]|nr:6,7-dimethyl-8-ribityllumazine synthase [Rubellimicrobium sp.]